MILIILIIEILSSLKINWSSTYLIHATRSNSTIKTIIHLINISWCLSVKSSVHILIYINGGSAWVRDVINSILKRIELHFISSRTLILNILIIVFFLFFILKFMLLNIWKIHFNSLLTKFYYRGIIFYYIFKD